MTMGRKHYREVAEVLRWNLRSAPSTPVRQKERRATVEGIAHDLAYVFKQDNIHFDRRRFMDAVFEEPITKEDL